MNGLMGRAGTGMALLGIVLFFVFVIFALDVRPFMNRMRIRAQRVAATLAPTPVFNEPEVVPQETAAEPLVTPVAEEAAPREEEVQQEEAQPWQLTLREEPTADEVELTDEEQEEEKEEENEEFLEYQKYLAEKEAEALAEREALASAKEEEPEFSFEVIQQEEQPAIKHGAHISIASNEPYAPELDLPDYKFPTLDLLQERTTEAISLDKEELEKNKTQIINTLRSFGIEIQRISATVGPTVTLYEIVPAEGVRISKIRNLEDDIALNLAALGI
eukprot:gene18764-18635_t